jgi:hypothetical protein
MDFIIIGIAFFLSLYYGIKLVKTESEEKKWNMKRKIGWFCLVVGCGGSIFIEILLIVNKI